MDDSSATRGGGHHRGNERGHLDRREADRTVIDAKRQMQSTLVDERSARVHHVRDVTILVAIGGGQQRPGQIFEDAARIVEVQQNGTDAVGAHRSDPVGQYQPAVSQRQRGAAVAQLE